MVFTELRAVAFVEDEDNTLVTERLQPLLVLVLVLSVEGDAQLLNRGNDDLVGIVLRKQPFYEGFGVGIFLNAPLLKFVELLTGLAVEVFSIHHKETFLDVVVVFKQSGCLEGGEAN